MRARILTLGGVLTLALSFPAAQAQPTETELKALGMIYSLTVVGGFNRDWCVARAPQTKAAVQTGYDGWLNDTKLNLLSQTARTTFGDVVNDIKTQLEETRAQIYAALDKAYPNPAQACQNFRAIMNSEMNPQKLYPAEYAAALKVQASPAPSAPAAPQVATGSTALAEEYELPRGSRVGGTLVFGTYACSRAKNNEPAKPLWSFQIYSQNEYRRAFTDKAPTYEGDSGSKGDASFYKYDPKTGWLDLFKDDDFSNSDFRAERGRFGIFYTDSAGRPVLYAEDGYGLGIYITTCVYAGANRYPAPSQVKAQQAKAEAAKEAEREKERNRYRTAPGAGLKLSQIATIVHEFSSNYDGQNTNVEETDTLLLNDGTAYLNLRWTPHDLDVKASRTGEPNQWTKWRKQGSEYQILKKGQWVKLAGIAMTPFAKNERISGAYSYKSYYQVGWFDNASVSYSESNYYFSQDGTFDRGGMNRTTGGTDMGGIKTSGVVQSNKPSTGGTYSVDGYTIQFRYNTGQVVRSYGFFWGGDKKSLVISGTTYSR